MRIKTLKIALLALLTFSLINCSRESGKSKEDTNNINIVAKANSDIKKEKEIINGYALPPEPDPKVNNSTLLGIDSNNNGVRDDVERWIYKHYKNPIEIAILMQSARANTSLLLSKTERHKPNINIQNVTSCMFYWIYKAKDRPLDKYELYAHADEVDAIQFNTIKRVTKKNQYEKSLTGGVYPVIPSSKEKCEFDVEQMLKDRKWTGD